MKSLSPRETFSAWQAGNLSIVDCREAAELALNHVSGSHHVPMSELVDRLDDLPEGRLAVICRSGVRSEQVAHWLTVRGEHGDVINVDGGLLAWVAEGLPYEGAPPE